jgi:hypothetical protein
MNISEAITQLQNLKSKHGDLDLYIQGEAKCIQHDVKSITGEEVKGEPYALIAGDNEFVV